jgi:hypothetical protein
MMKERIGIAFIALILLVIGYLFFQDEYATYGWQVATATVRYSQVDTEAYTTTYFYKYKVSDEEYRGKDQERGLNPRGERTYITVFYDPNKPSKSAMKRGLTVSTVTEILVGVILISVAIFTGKKTSSSRNVKRREMSPDIVIFLGILLVYAGIIGIPVILIILLRGLGMG